MKLTHGMGLVCLAFRSGGLGSAWWEEAPGVKLDGMELGMRSAQERGQGHSWECSSHGEEARLEMGETAA